MDYSGYNIGRDKITTLVVIKAIGKGALPKQLKSFFTSVGQAQKAIDGYVIKKGKLNGQTNSGDEHI